MAGVPGHGGSQDAVGLEVDVAFVQCHGVQQGCTGALGRSARRIRTVQLAQHRQRAVGALVDVSLNVIQRGGDTTPRPRAAGRQQQHEKKEQSVKGLAHGSGSFANVGRFFMIYKKSDLVPTSFLQPQK